MNLNLGFITTHLHSCVWIYIDMDAIGPGPKPMVGRIAMILWIDRIGAYASDVDREAFKIIGAGLAQCFKNNSSTIC